jgi:hypothetical protein
MAPIGPAPPEPEVRGHCPATDEASELVGMLLAQFPLKLLINLLAKMPFIPLTGGVPGRGVDPVAGRRGNPRGHPGREGHRPLVEILVQKEEPPDGRREDRASSAQVAGGPSGGRPEGRPWPHRPGTLWRAEVKEKTPACAVRADEGSAHVPQLVPSPAAGHPGGLGAAADPESSPQTWPQDSRRWETNHAIVIAPRASEASAAPGWLRPLTRR